MVKNSDLKALTLPKHGLTSS